MSNPDEVKFYEYRIALLRCFLERHPDYYTWPKYYRQLIFCSNLADNVFYLRVLCFIIINNFNLHLFLEVIQLCNPYFYTYTGIDFWYEEVFRCYSFLLNVTNKKTYSSYDVKRKLIVYMDGTVKSNVVKNIYVDYNRYLCNNYFSLTGLEQFKLLE